LRACNGLLLQACSDRRVDTARCARTPRARLARIVDTAGAMSNDRDRGAIATGVLVVGLVACGLAVLPSPALGAERFALVKELVIHVVAVLACGVSCGRRPRALIDRRLAPPLLAVIALAALSFAVRGGNAWEAMRSAGLLASIAIVFLVARVAAPRALAIGTVAAVTVIAVGVLLEAHGVYALAPLPPGGTIGNRNAVAHLIALALPLVVTVGLAARRRGLLATAVALAITSDALVLTRCRAALLALAVAGALALILARPGRRHLALAAAIALGATAAIALPNRLAWSTASPYRDTLARIVEVDQGSGHGRLVQYRATLAMIADHPGLGVGPGRWSVRYPDYAAAGDPSYQPAQLFPVNRLASSDWLGLAAALGLPAILALAVFAARYARLALDRRAVAALATLAILGVLGAVDTVLGRAAPALVAAICLGALLPAGEPARPGRAAARWLVPAGEPARPGRAAARWLVPAGEPARPGRAAARWLVPAVALAPALVVGRLTVAAYVYGDGAAPALEAAARLAPGSLYFDTYLARRLLRRGDCARGRAIADGVLADFPQLVALRDLARACVTTDSGDRHAYDVQVPRHYPPRQRDVLGLRR
jgi:O-antigen ligase